VNEVLLDEGHEVLVDDNLVKGHPAFDTDYPTPDGTCDA